MASVRHRLSLPDLPVVLDEHSAKYHATPAVTHRRAETRHRPLPPTTLSARFSAGSCRAASAEGSGGVSARLGSERRSRISRGSSISAERHPLQCRPRAQLPQRDRRHARRRAPGKVMMV